MKFVFIDEFKYETTVTSRKVCWYGLVANVIDSYYYKNYKSGFEKAFKNLNWNGEELKGRYTYSKKGDKAASIDDRIKFTKGIFSLSTSKGGKNAVVKTYVTFSVFEPTEPENKKYERLLEEIVKKIEQPASKTGDKGLFAFFLDGNDALDCDKISKVVKQNLKKNNFLFERPFFVDSCNLNPGIILADFVCYFHENFIRLKNFSKKTKKEFILLATKLKKDSIFESELDKLEGLLLSKDKLKKSLEIIGVLKKVIYV